MHFAFSVSKGTSLYFRLDKKQAVKSKAWQRYITNDPLFYHGGYKFGGTQVLVKNESFLILNPGFDRRDRVDFAPAGKPEDTVSGSAWRRGSNGSGVRLQVIWNTTKLYFQLNYVNSNSKK